MYFIKKRMRCVFSLALSLLLAMGCGLGYGPVMADSFTVVTGHLCQPDGTELVGGAGSQVTISLRTTDRFRTTVMSTILSGGEFSLSGSIPTGDYTLNAEVESSDNIYTDAVPISIHLEEGVNATQDICLTNPSITGVVYIPDGSAPFNAQGSPDNYVEIRSPDPYWAILDSKRIGNGGVYRLGGDIPSGDYIVTVWVKGISNPYANSVPVRVHIEAGQLTTQDMTLNNPTITGKVLKPDGTEFTSLDYPIHLVFVPQAFGQRPVAETTANSDGSFKLGGQAPTGDYILSTDLGGVNNPYTNATPISIHITEGVVPYQEVRLTAPAMKGFLRQPDGTPFISGPESTSALGLTRVSDNMNVASAGLNADGSFSLGENLPTGDYIVRAGADGIDHPFAEAIPSVVHIIQGQTLQQDVYLTTPSVKGWILKPDGTPFIPEEFSRLHVNIKSIGPVDTLQLPDMGVLRDGSFKVRGGIPTGDYIITTAAYGKDNPCTGAAPVPVHIEAGSTTPVTITLTNPSIWGYVLKPDGSPFISGAGFGAHVSLVDPSTNTQVTWAELNTDGSYKLGGAIPEGDYNVYAYADGDSNPYSSSLPIAVHVIPGQPLARLDVSLTNPAITGLVLKPDGTTFIPGPGAGATIVLKATDAQQNEIARGWLYNDGSFRFGGGIPTGDYTLSAYTNGDNNPYADSTPIPVHIEAGVPVVRDITLTNPSITGTLLKPDGTPFIPGPGAGVDILLKTTDAGQHEIARAWPDGNGAFRFGGGIPAGDYTLNAYTNGDSNPYSNSAPVPVHIEAGVPVVRDVSLTSPSISGTVLKPDGTLFIPSQDSWVNIDLKTAGPENSFITSTGVNNNGTFKFGGNIPDGDYMLYANPNGPNSPYTSAAPVPVHVTAGITSTVNINLTNPMVTGRVLKPDGTPFIFEPGTGADIVLKTTDAAQQEIARTWPDGNGFFKFGGSIPTGDYNLTAYLHGNIPYVCPIAIPVHIDAGVSVVRDITLTNPAITGRVLKPDGTPFIPGPDSGFDVVLNIAGQKNEVARTQLNNDGSFKLGGGIPTGDYNLNAYAYGGNNPYPSSAPVPVHIEAGVPVVRDINLTNPAITGRILKPDGTPFIPGPDTGADIVLKTTDAAQQEIARTWPDGNGFFKFGGGIPAGDYNLSAYLHGNIPYVGPAPIPVHIDAGVSIVRDITLTNPAITGRVLKPDGTPFIPGPDSGFDVVLNVAGQKNEVARTQLNNDGSFKLGGGIPTGDYNLNAYAFGGNNPYASSAPVPVHIEVGVPVVRDITLSTPSITGTVLKPDGTPFMQGPDSWVNIDLRTTGPENNFIAGTGVNGNGTFKLGTNIPTGDYMLYANANGSNNPCTSAAPIPVHIDAGVTSTITVTLTNPAITGRVLKPDGTPFIPGPDSGFDVVLNIAGQKNEIARTRLNNDGSFKLGGGIPTGDYNLNAYTFGGNNPYASSAPIPVHIEAGVPVVRDITLTNPIVTGRILKPDGTPFIPGPDTGADIVLKTTDASQQEIARTWPDGNGFFKFGGGIPAGDYNLTAYLHGNIPYVGPAPIPVHIDAGVSIVRDITLTNPAITGRVLKPDGTPFIPGPDSGFDVVLNIAGQKNEIARTQLNSDGSFKLGGGIPTGDYNLNAYAYGGNNPYASSAPVPVHIEVGVPVVRDITLSTPSITGTVLKPDGTPFMQGPDSGVNIDLRTAGPENNFIAGTGVNGNGTFKLGTNIPTGDYMLYANANGSNNPYTSAAPVPVHIDAGVTSTITVTLTNPLITGRVLNPDGTPFISGQDSGFDVVLNTTGQKGNEVARTRLNNDGSFKLGGGIPTGDYNLNAYAFGGNNPYASSAPIPVHIEAGVPVVRDINLTNPSITGTVLKPDGTPFMPGPDSWVNIDLRTTGPENNFIAGTGVNGNGTFKLGTNIPTGDYMLYANSNGSNNPYTSAAPINVHINAGIISNVTVTLTNPIITGRVLKPDGTNFMPGPDAGVGLELRTAGQENNHVADTGVNGDGTFRLGGGIPTGDYKLYAHSDGSNNPYTDALPVFIHIEAGVPVATDITLTNPNVTGRIFKPDGTPFIPGPDAGFDVVLNTAGQNWNEIARTKLNNDGTFKLGGIPGGDYNLDAFAWGSNNPYVNSAPVPVHIEAGAPVVRDITLSNPAVSGRILKPDGTGFMPGPDAWVDVELRTTGPESSYIAGTGVNGDGTFKLGSNIPTGDYMLYAYSNGSNNPYTSAAPINVHIDAGIISNVTVTLTNPIITGQVFKPDGTNFMPGPDSEASLMLQTTTPEHDVIAKADLENDGSFKLGGGIPAGDYTLKAFAWGSNNPYANSVPSAVHIAAGISVTSDLTLTVPVITGRVLKPDGAPFNQDKDFGANVELRTAGPGSQAITYAQVNSDGSYKIGENTAPGNYVLLATTWGNNPWGGSEPVNVSVTAGQITTTDLSLTVRALSPIIPSMAFDKTNYMPGDTVQLALNLAGVQPGNRTNSAAFEIEYDGSSLELATGNPGSDIQNRNIPFDTRLDLGAGQKKRIVVSYTSLNNDITLQNGPAFTVNFKFKDNAGLGEKAFRLAPVTMLDSTGYVYNVNDGKPVDGAIQASGDVTLEGYVNIYLGEAGMSFYNTVVGGLNQESINQALGNLRFTLKQNADDPGITFMGSSVFIPDGNGNLAVKDADNMVTGRFRISLPNYCKTILRIEGAGYLVKELKFSPTAGQVYTISTPAAPIVLYPGDLARIAGQRLEFIQDGKIDTSDFSGWQKIYTDYTQGHASEQDKMRADFTRDGVVDSTDYMLWDEAHRKALTQP